MKPKITIKRRVETWGFVEDTKYQVDIEFLDLKISSRLFYNYYDKKGKQIPVDRIRKQVEKYILNYFGKL